MRKLSYVLLVLALMLPLAIPFAPALAQESATVVAALETYNANLPAGYGNVSVADLSVEMIEKPNLVLLDVRQPQEYAEAHIPGAFNIPLRELARREVAQTLERSAKAAEPETGASRLAAGRLILQGRTSPLQASAGPRFRDARGRLPSCDATRSVERPHPRPLSRLAGEGRWAVRLRSDTACAARAGASGWPRRR